MAKPAIVRSTEAYERWQRDQLRGDIVRKDLRKKHRRMAEAPFPFLRATYWRWCEAVLERCPELAGTPAVLAVGDLHLENFGTWRDAQGRLVWGVCDFDEAARMPYALDLLRLATSAMLGDPALTADDACTLILDGYAAGLAAPRATVLDAEHEALRALVAVTPEERARFWAELAELKPGAPTRRYLAALHASMPDVDGPLLVFKRSAGLGSLGRPRFVGTALWRGGRVVREAKAALPSAWSPERRNRSVEVATGRYRSPDPWYGVTRGVLVRRLSPDNHKVEAATHADALTNPIVLRAMGADLAAVHLGQRDVSQAIEADLEARPASWLDAAAARMAAWVREEQSVWERWWRAHEER